MLGLKIVLYAKYQVIIQIHNICRCADSDMFSACEYLKQRWDGIMMLSLTLIKNSLMIRTCNGCWTYWEKGRKFHTGVRCIIIFGLITRLV